MERTVNDCVGCKDIGLPCRGNSCPYRNVRVLVCDQCGDEVDTLYVVDGEQLCGDCLLGSFEKVVADNW